MDCNGVIPNTASGFLVVLLMLLHLTACRSEPSQAAPVVEDLSYSLLPSGARIVTGRLFNPADVDLAGAQIQISLFDAENSRVGSISIGVQNVPAGGRVSFREPIQTDLDVQAARVRSVIVL
jgi:hypothetical protein